MKTLLMTLVLMTSVNALAAEVETECEAMSESRTRSAKVTTETVQEAPVSESTRE